MKTQNNNYMNPLVSVVIPIYNVEKWIRKCIDSIISQTYTNLEILLVDDGSPDKCPQICDEYAARDSRIKVLHKKNGGLVSAKKCGYEKATGSYLIWVDGDDWLYSYTIEKLVKKAESENVDVVWCDITAIYQDHNSHIRLNYVDNSESMLHHLLEKKVPGWSCNKLVRLDFYNGIKLQFNIGDDMFEDVYLSTQILLGKPKMTYIPEPLYCYNRCNINAFTSINQEGIWKKSKPNIIHIYDLLLGKRLFDEYKISFSYLAMSLKTTYLLAGSIEEARSIFPYAHKILEGYPVYGIVRFFFYIIFNGGFIGKLLLKVYLLMKHDYNSFS